MSARLDRAGFERAAGVSRETGARFEAWRQLLETWNRRINLVGPATLADFWERHALDSAQLYDLAPDAERWIDMGAGAGFPGLAIALMAQDRGRPIEMVLLEATAKKAAFLREANRVVGARARVLEGRIEDQAGPVVDCVVARALAPLDRLVALAAPFCGPETRGLFLKGRGVHAEIAALVGAERTLAPTLHVSRSDPEGRIVALRLSPPTV